jgi:hypothetical protein
MLVDKGGDPILKFPASIDTHSHIPTYHLSEIGRLNSEGSYITVHHEPLVGPRLVVVMRCVVLH